MAQLTNIIMQNVPPHIAARLGPAGVLDAFNAIVQQFPRLLLPTGPLNEAAWNNLSPGLRNGIVNQFLVEAAARAAPPGTISQVLHALGSTGVSLLKSDFAKNAAIASALFGIASEFMSPGLITEPLGRLPGHGLNALTSSVEMARDLITAARDAVRNPIIGYQQKTKLVKDYTELVPEPPRPDHTIADKLAAKDIAPTSLEYQKYDKVKWAHTHWSQDKQNWELAHPKGENVTVEIPIRFQDAPKDVQEAYPYAHRYEPGEIPSIVAHKIEAEAAKDAGIPIIDSKGGAKKGHSTAWTRYVKAYAKKHKLTFFQALRPAHVAYSKKHQKGAGYFRQLAQKHNVALM